MANRQDDNFLATNREYRAMRRPASQTKKKVANLVVKAISFSRLAMPLRVLRQVSDGVGQAGVPSIRLVFGTMCRPPVVSGLHFTLRLIGNHNAQAHASVSI